MRDGRSARHGRTRRPGPNSPPEIDQLLITMCQTAQAACQLSDPAGRAVAAVLMTIGDQFASVMGAFAAGVEERINLAVETAGNA